MYQVDVADNQECLPVDAEAVREVVHQTLEAEQVAAATISIAIVDNPTMHELNRQYLNHDYETDVLSFLLEESSHPEIDVPRGAGRTIDGEVIVSAPYARQMSVEYDWPPENELALYIVHGVLHLCGYDDTTADILKKSFETAYDATYTRRIPGLEVEVMNWTLRLSAVMERPTTCPPMPQANRIRPAGSRQMFDPAGGEMGKIGVYRRDSLQPGDEITGPAAIVEDETTSIVLAGFTARINAVGYIVMRREIR